MRPSLLIWITANRWSSPINSMWRWPPFLHLPLHFSTELTFLPTTQVGWNQTLNFQLQARKLISHSFSSFPLFVVEDSQSAFHVGLWKVYKANRNSNATVSGNGAGSISTPTGNASRSAVSIWVHSLSSRGKEREVIVAQLKKEVSIRLRKVNRIKEGTRDWGAIEE